MNIVDIHGLSDVLCTTPATLRKRWREFPHIYVGTGKNLKSARFVVERVLEYLENVGMENQERAVDSKVCPRRAPVQKRRLPDSRKGSGMGSRRETAVEGPATGHDPFGLYRGLSR